MRTVWLALVVGLLVAGCASVPDVVKALAKDNASVCIVLDAALYGRAMICRTNAARSSLGATKDGLHIEHAGK